MGENHIRHNIFSMYEPKNTASCLAGVLPYTTLCGIYAKLRRIYAIFWIQNFCRFKGMPRKRAILYYSWAVAKAFFVCFQTPRRPDCTDNWAPPVRAVTGYGRKTFPVAGVGKKRRASLDFLRGHGRRRRLPPENEPSTGFWRAPNRSCGRLARAVGRSRCSASEVRISSFYDVSRLRWRATTCVSQR